MGNTCWVVMWSSDDSGYSDDIRIFSTQDKCYNYLHKEITKQLDFYIENDHKNSEYYQNKYHQLIDELNNVFDQNYISFSIPDFTGFYEIQQINIDNEQ